jgi:hypothetical protein
VICEFPKGHIIVAFRGEKKVDRPAGATPEDTMEIRKGVGRGIGDVGGKGLSVPGPVQDWRLIDDRRSRNGRKRGFRGAEGNRKKRQEN